MKGHILIWKFLSTTPMNCEKTFFLTSIYTLRKLKKSRFQETRSPPKYLSNPSFFFENGNSFYFCKTIHRLY
uniref:Putative ovule protein n=1 Tax=Solanum chacoense TaxID=4108 RepID=A0A0V0GY51_SOLCH